MSQLALIFGCQRQDSGRAQLALIERDSGPADAQGESSRSVQSRITGLSALAAREFPISGLPTIPVAIRKRYGVTDGLSLSTSCKGAM
jgi:hypothetical protein